MASDKQRRETRILDTRKEVSWYWEDTRASYERSWMAMETSEQILSTLNDTTDPSPSLLEQLNGRVDEAAETVENAREATYRARQIAGSCRDYAAKRIDIWDMSDQRVARYQPKTFGDLVDDMDQELKHIRLWGVKIGEYDASVRRVRAQLPTP